METYYKTRSVSVTLVFVPGVHRPCETTKIFPAKSNRKWILSPGLVTRHCMAFVLHRNRLSPYSLFLSYRQTLMLSVISSLSHWTHTLFLPAEFSLSLSPFIPLLLFSPCFSHLGPSGRLPPFPPLSEFLLFRAMVVLLQQGMDKFLQLTVYFMSLCHSGNLCCFPYFSTNRVHSDFANTFYIWEIKAIKASVR